MGVNIYVQKVHSSPNHALPFTSMVSGGEFKIQNRQPANYWAGVGANSSGGYTVRLSYQICRAFLEYLAGNKVFIGREALGSRSHHIEIAGSRFYLVMRMDETTKVVRYMITDNNRNLIDEAAAEQLLFPRGTTTCYWAVALPFILARKYREEPRYSAMKTNLSLKGSVDEADVFWLNDLIYQDGKKADGFHEVESFVYDESLYDTGIVEIVDETSLHSIAQHGNFEFGTINGQLATAGFNAAPQAQPQVNSQTQPTQTTRTQSDSDELDSDEYVSAADMAQFRIINESALSEDEKLLVPENDLALMKIPAKIYRACAAIYRRIDTKDPMRNLILYGEAGAGKSTAAEVIAQSLGLPFRSTNLDLNSEASDVIGEFIPDGDGGWIYCSPAFLQTYEKGGVVELVEINYARPGALGVLNSAMDKKNILQLKNGRIIKRHRNCVIVATINVDYEGCLKLNKALKSRHQRKIYIQRLSDEALMDLMAIYTGNRSNEAKVLYKKMVAAMHGMETIIEDDSIDGIITTRELQEWAEEALATGDAIEAAEDTILSGITFYKAEQKTLKDAVLSHLL